MNQQGTDGLAGATALITGATSGIGLASAEALAARGAGVVLVGRDKTRGDEAVARLAAAGHRSAFVPADVSDPHDLDRVVEAARSWGGGHVDVLVNNAAYFPAGMTTATTGLDDLDTAHAVNVRAPFLLVRALAPAMAEHGRGAIVNVLATAAFVGMPGLGLYGGTKAALGLLTKSWAAEFGPSGVRVNAVSPGPTRTPGVARFGDFIDHLGAAAPAGRTADPAEIAAAVAWLAGPDASFVHGTVLDVDGGRLAV